jgi:hypothetical protein
VKEKRDKATRQAWIAARRLANRSYVVDLRSKTPCLKCGRTPIEYHRVEHEAHPVWRVANLYGRSRARIDAEIALCEPLCRRCHVIHDGRAAALAAQPRKVVGLKPCQDCGRESKPLRKGRCGRCSQRHSRPPKFTPEELSAFRAAALSDRNKTPRMRQIVSETRRREHAERKDGWK